MLISSLLLLFIPAKISWSCVRCSFGYFLSVGNYSSKFFVAQHIVVFSLGFFLLLLYHKLFVFWHLPRVLYTRFGFFEIRIIWCWNGKFFTHVLNMFSTVLVADVGSNKDHLYFEMLAIMVYFVLLFERWITCVCVYHITVLHFVWSCLRENCNNFCRSYWNLVVNA